MRAPTQRQFELLRAIQYLTARNKRCPSRQELADQLGVVRTAIAALLVGLVKKGRVSLGDGQRNIQVCGDCPVCGHPLSPCPNGQDAQTGKIPPA